MDAPPPYMIHLVTFTFQNHRLYGFMVYEVFEFDNWEKSGTFGDPFGALNVFFTGAVNYLSSYNVIFRRSRIKMRLINTRVRQLLGK